jgi:hypothetical protein
MRYRHEADGDICGNLCATTLHRRCNRGAGDVPPKIEKNRGDDE